MPVPRDIRRSDPKFGDSWATCSYEANLPGREFERQVLEVVTWLLNEGPDRADQENEIKWFPISPDYQLAYAWITDRDEHGNAIFDHLALLLVERN